MLLNKTLTSLKQDGLLATIKRVLNHPRNRLERNRFEKTVLKLDDIERKFTWIYENNFWGNESVSGPGSTPQYTENLRRELPKIVARFEIKSILDAPCGDFNWMKLVLPELNVHYIGADIVKELIAAHKARHESNTVTFMTLDVTADRLPTADLMICRDCLFHLSYADIRRFFENFVRADIPYLLTTTHKNKSNFRNTDIATGDFRVIDLFSSPFNLPAAPLARIDDWMAPEPEREMCLFTREQIKQALAR